LSGLVDLQDIQPDGIERTTIAFGDWAPDVPGLNNQGCVEALNVIPVDQCFAPFPQLEPNPTAIAPDVVRGAAAVVSEDDTVQLYVGTVAGLYTREGGVGFSNLLVAATSDKYSWKFIRVNEQMVAVHPEVFPQRSPVGTTTAMVTLGGTPPRAACGGQVGDFLMLGNLLDDPDDFHGVFPSRIRWGGFNNIDSPWISDPATQADFQDMPAEGGGVVAISGRDVGTIFQRRMISRATYRGPPEIFDIVTVEDKRGAIARDCIVDVGAFQFYIAEDGFFIWNGTNSTPIGDARVNRYFFNQLQYSQRSKICGAVDFLNGCVMWGFPTDDSGILNEVIIYSYRENKWTHSIQTLEYLFNSAASNTTLEELTDPLETYIESFDSGFYRQGGQTHIAGFNDDHTYGLFTGLPLPATFETGENTGPDGRRVFINNVRPLIDLASPAATVQIITRDQFVGQPEQFTDFIPQELDGQCPVIADGRYVRIRVNVPIDTAWLHAMGVEVSRKAAGVF
jgi:hypothetical protein